MDETFVSHFDRCLGCMACVTACPSGVQYGKLIEATRAQIERNYRRPFLDRLFRRLIFAVFPHPQRLRWLMLPLWFYQRSGLRWLLRKTGLLRLLPERLRSMESLLPELQLRALFAAASAGCRTAWRTVPPRKPRLRVGVLLGCVQRVLFSNVNAATVRVLAALGCEVVVPRNQQCCGALMAHAGREPEALDAARRLIEVFERAEVDVVAVNAAGCGSNLREYAYLLRDDPEFASRAQAFAAKCRDITELIAELGFESPANPVPLKVAYHDACHLQHAQGIRTQPRQLLSAIPGLEWTELARVRDLLRLRRHLQPHRAGDRPPACRPQGPARHSAPERRRWSQPIPGCLLHIASGLQPRGPSSARAAHRRTHRRRARALVSRSISEKLYPATTVGCPRFRAA